jgi:general secretion pathway protein A
VALAIGLWALWQIAPWSGHMQDAVASSPPQHKPIQTIAPIERASAAAPTVQPGAAAAVTNPPPPAAPSLAQLLDRYKAETDPDNAFTQLFRLWKANYVAGEVDPCTQAQQQGLQCLMQRGSFGQLRHYNRPAILLLNDGKGGTHQVVMATLTDEDAQIDLGGARRAISIAELSRYWYGDFVLLQKRGKGAAAQAPELTHTSTHSG